MELDDGVGHVEIRDDWLELDDVEGHDELEGNDVVVDLESVLDLDDDVDLVLEEVMGLSLIHI